MHNDEASRLDAVRRYAILDTPPDGAFDRIVAIAARTLSVPIALVSIVDEDRIWFKARHGLDIPQIDRAPGLCASAILNDGQWLVENAALDVRTLSNPLVAGEFGLRFYAGVPLTTKDGHNLGTLCVIDRQPRTISEDETAFLKDLASLVIDQLELRLTVREAAANQDIALARADSLGKEAKILSAMVQSSQDAIITKDTHGIVTTWNQAAEHIFGYSEMEMIGQPILRLIPPDRVHEESYVLGSIIRGERIEHYETLRRHKSGRIIPISLTVSPIWDDAGNVIGASKIARDVSDRKESEQRIQMLMREVNHRVRNQYAVILAMVRQTAHTAETTQQFETRVRERIMALSLSHDLLVEGEWRGSTISDLLKRQIKPFSRSERLEIAGPTVMLSPMAVQYLGMAFHELGTNASKHGALSDPNGRIAVSWRTNYRDGEPWLELTWTERDGPEVADITHSGFGTTVLERIAPTAISGVGTLARLPAGMRWSLNAPLQSLEPRQPVLADTPR